MRRWVLNLGLCSIRLHHWLASDDDRNYHDHPWSFVTFVLKGGYWDATPDLLDRLNAPCVAFRRAEHRHTVVIDRHGCWTLLLTGPVRRKWGFWVNGKFKKANKYFLEHGHHGCPA